MFYCFRLFFKVVVSCISSNASRPVHLIQCISSSAKVPRSSALRCPRDFIWQWNHMESYGNIWTHIDSHRTLLLRHAFSFVCLDWLPPVYPHGHRFVYIFDLRQNAVGHVAKLSLSAAMGDTTDVSVDSTNNLSGGCDSGYAGQVKDGEPAGYSLAFNPSRPALLATGDGHGGVRVWRLGSRLVESQVSDLPGCLDAWMPVVSSSRRFRSIFLLRVLFHLYCCAPQCTTRLQNHVSETPKASRDASRIFANLRDRCRILDVFTTCRISVLHVLTSNCIDSVRKRSYWRALRIVQMMVRMGRKTNTARVARVGRRATLPEKTWTTRDL